MIRYKPAQDIFNSVAEELYKYSEEGSLDYSFFYKVIKECNAFLGLDINQERETVLDLKQGKVRLPHDFVSLNFAVLCKSSYISNKQPSGFQVEYVDVDTTKQLGCQTNACAGDCGDFVVFQKCNEEFKEYTQIELVKVVNTSSGSLNSGCFNLNSVSTNEISIKNGWLYANFNEGSIYINYVGDMVDQQGNLLVVDHDLINPYYEASCIYNFFRRMFTNHEGDEFDRARYWKAEYEEKKRLAILVRNMPEYDELTSLFKHNRIAYYNKYERYFKTWYSTYGYRSY